MMPVRDALKLYFIMGSNNCLTDPIHVLEQAIKGGITCFQFREKGDGAYTGAEKEALAISMQQLCQAHNIPFIVNDDLALADKLNADGVHVGQDDEPITVVRKQFQNKIVGLSVHNIAEAKQAVKQSVDYIGFGPIYSTATKEDAKEAVGTDAVRKMRAEGIDLPLVAIGGINEANAAEIMKAGADGISLISAISQASNPSEASQKLREQLFLHN